MLGRERLGGGSVAVLDQERVLKGEAGVGHVITGLPAARVLQKGR